jgi:hypothetical protein
MLDVFFWLIIKGDTSISIKTCFPELCKTHKMLLVSCCFCCVGNIAVIGVTVVAGVTAAGGVTHVARVFAMISWQYNFFNKAVKFSSVSCFILNIAYPPVQIRLSIIIL